MERTREIEMEILNLSNLELFLHDKNYELALSFIKSFIMNLENIISID
jgi:hypothetical protein